MLSLYKTCRFVCKKYTTADPRLRENDGSITTLNIDAIAFYDVFSLFRFPLHSTGEFSLVPNQISLTRRQKKVLMNFGLASDNDGKSIGSNHNSRESSFAFCRMLKYFVLSIGWNWKIIQCPWCHLTLVRILHQPNYWNRAFDKVRFWKSFIS